MAEQEISRHEAICSHDHFPHLHRVSNARYVNECVVGRWKVQCPAIDDRPVAESKSCVEQEEVHPIKVMPAIFPVRFSFLAPIIECLQPGDTSKVKSNGQTETASSEYTRLFINISDYLNRTARGCGPLTYSQGPLQALVPRQRAPSEREQTSASSLGSHRAWQFQISAVWMGRVRRLIPPRQKCARS